MAVKQLLKGRKQGRDINSFTLSGSLYPQIDNGFGRFIDDLSGVQETISYTNPVRIFKVKKSVKKTVNGNDIFTFENVYVMRSDNITVVDEGLVFTYNGIEIKVIKRVPIIKFETVIEYEYELREITDKRVY